MRVIHCILLLGLVLIAGCITDKLVVFEKGILSDEEMKVFLGAWELTELHALDGKRRSFEKGNLVIQKDGPRYQFSLKITRGDSEEVAGHFLLSKIPDSKSGLLLFSCPTLKMKTKEHEESEVILNFFCILKRDGNTIHFWWVGPDRPVAKGRLSSSRGGSAGYQSEDVTSFLEDYADAYVLANAPLYTFKKK